MHDLLCRGVTEQPPCGNSIVGSSFKIIAMNVTCVCYICKTDCQPAKSTTKQQQLFESFCRFNSSGCWDRFSRTVFRGAPQDIVSVTASLLINLVL